jgi:hypothetical protein
MSFVVGCIVGATLTLVAGYVVLLWWLRGMWR